MDETHVKLEKAKGIINRSFPGWSFITNYEFSNLGKFWIIWNPSIYVTVTFKSLQMVTCMGKLPTSVEFAVSFVYGSNFEEEIKLLWKDLVSTASSPGLSGTPWCVLGDFNQILDGTEQSSEDPFIATRAMREFRSCLRTSPLHDLNYRGSTYTYMDK